MINRQLLPSVIVISIAVVYFVVAIVPICDPSTLWGLSHLYFLGWPARLVVLFGSLLIAAVAMAVGTKLELTPSAAKALVYFVVPVALLVVFYLLRVKTHYLGDGVIRAREIEFGIRWISTEPLGHYLNYLCHSILFKVFGWSSIQSVAALSVLSGVAFYFAALDLVKTLFSRAADQLVAFIVLFFSGTTLLFCGYVESYLFFPALIAAYAASGVRVLENHGSAAAPIRLYLLLVLFHFQFLYLAPTLLYIVYRQFRQGATKSAVSGIIAVLISLAAVIVIPIWMGKPTLGLGGFLIDLTPGSPYWLFSGQHLLDIMNQLLLTAFVPITLSIAVISTVRKRPIEVHSRLSFAGLLLPGAFAFVSLLKPELGYASDWDLFSSAGVAVGVFAVTLYSAYESFSIGRLAQTLLCTAAILSFLAFAVVNGDADKALARQVDILAIAGEQGAVGFETLGSELIKDGKNDLAEEMWKRSAEIRPNARVIGNLGQLAFGQQRFAEAESYLKRALELDSNRALFALDLGLTYAWQGRYDLGEVYLRKAVALAPYEAKYYHNLALFLSQNRNLAEAESYSRRAVELEPGNAIYATALGTILSMLGNNAEAEKFLLQAIRSQPDLANACIKLSAIYLNMGESERARRILSDYLTRFPDSRDAARVRQALSEVGK